MRELEHQQKEYTKENTPPIQKKPIPAKRTNAPRKKDKNELQTVVKQLMSQIELLEKRQEQLINNSKHNRTDLTHQTPDETIAYRPLDMNKRREKHQKICWRCGQPGHIAIGCKVRLDNSRKFDRAMIYQLVTNENQPTPTTYNKEERICGPANEVSISINGIDTKALLDTGSSVSTIKSVKAICSSIQRQPYVECLAVTAKDLASKVDTKSTKKIDIREEQQRDPVIRTWINYLSRGQRPRKEDIPSSPAHNQLFNNFDKLVIQNGILYLSINEEEELEKPRPTPAPRLRPRKNRETDPQPTPSLHDSTLTSSDEQSDDDYLVYVVREPDVDDLSAPHSAIDELETQDDDDTVQDEADDDQEHVAEQQDTEIEGDDRPSKESDTVDPVLEPDEVSETDHQVADTTLSDDTEEPGQDTTVDETVDNVRQPEIEEP
ncbi:unnamed protein product [Mytilus coruscus]|uniref:CCHC-type domain-containing protein n=1 Tax=Mytilus coruscus TaxID=42192 RepID=A0A6J8AWJ7_MYTCO|nr:unnamed protein product [Mytilus coruscus]